MARQGEAALTRQHGRKWQSSLFFVTTGCCFLGFGGPLSIGSNGLEEGVVALGSAMDSGPGVRLFFSSLHVEIADRSLLHPVNLPEMVLGHLQGKQIIKSHMFATTKSPVHSVEVL